MTADLLWSLAAALEFGERHALRLTPLRPPAPVIPAAVEPEGT